MIEMFFIQGGDAMGIRVIDRIIQIRGKTSNYSWIDLRDLTSEQSKSASEKLGSKWLNEYNEAKELRDNMNEEEIAKDLKKDMQKSGWRCAKTIK